MAQEIFLPTFSHWEHGNKWFGSLGTHRFLVTPTQESLEVQLWQGPMALEFSLVELTASFPLTQEGLDALKTWLEEQCLAP